MKISLGRQKKEEETNYEAIAVFQVRLLPQEINIKKSI